MATSNFLRYFESSTGFPITTGTIELQPTDKSYPTGALSLTYLGDGVWERIDCPYGKYDLYINGIISPKYQDFWIGSDALTKIADNFSVITDENNITTYKLKSTGLRAQLATIDSLSTTIPDYIGQIGVDPTNTKYIAKALTGTMWEPVFDSQTIESEIATNQGNITANASNITQNATTISLNVARTTTNYVDELGDVYTDENGTPYLTDVKNDIYSNREQTKQNYASIVINADSITSNVTAIQGNANNISTNSTTITQNADSINLNATNITINGQNTTTNSSNITINANGISSNVTSISTNADNISTNSTNITQNVNSISLNATSISTNQNDISANASNITINANSISSNVSNISINANGISTNASNITQNANDITLKVSTTDYNGATIVSKINIESSTISIDSKNINITGTTTFANGSDLATNLNNGTTTIDGGIITANSITGNNIAASTITGWNISDFTITSQNIAAFTITAANIASNTITADKLSVTTLSAIAADLGTVTAGSITGITITGGTLQTATSGQRVVINPTDNPNTIVFWDSTGNTASLMPYSSGVYGGIATEGFFHSNVGITTAGYISANELIFLQANLLAATPKKAIELDKNAVYSNVGITIGGDTNIYRSAASILKTDGAFESSSISSSGNILTGGAFQTATSGNRVEISSSDNAISFYGNPGFTTNKTWNISDVGDSASTQLQIRDEYAALNFMNFYNDASYNAKIIINNNVILNTGAITSSSTINAVSGFKYNGTAGFTGTVQWYDAALGNIVTLTAQGGIITSLTSV